MKFVETFVFSIGILSVAYQIAYAAYCNGKVKIKKKYSSNYFK